MAKTKKDTAEMRRRKEQSSRDKKSLARKPAVTMGKSRMPRQVRGQSNGYSKLILDPCNAQFSQSNMPGNGGAQQVRVPFRLVTTAPSTAQTANGNSTTSGYNCNTLIGVLTPHAMVSGAGPTAFSVLGLVNESTVPGTGASGPAFLTGDPPGLSALSSYVGEMRPVAACIRITCLGTDIQNSGMFFGYEGSCKQFAAHSGDDTTAYQPITSAQNIIFNGQSTSQTFKTYEVRINYANADPEWQEFRQLTGATSGTTGVYRSGDASDPDWSEMPIAIVGVTSATPGCNYLFDGAIVYEWQPKVAVGMVAPKKVPADATALTSTAKTVQTVANKLGGMLISTVADFASGGSASAALGLLRQGYAEYTSRKPKGPMIGY